VGVLFWRPGIWLALKLNRRGSVAMQMGLLLTTLIGMAGLGSEIPYLMYKQRQLQIAADAAAVSAAVAQLRGYPGVVLEANGVAAALGFRNGAGGVGVVVNNPPAGGNYTGNNNAVEVVISQVQALPIAGFFGVPYYNLSARSVATSGLGGRYCVLVLDPTTSTTTRVLGTDLSMINCGIAVNSSGSAALQIAMLSNVSAPLASVTGNYTVDSSSTVNIASLKTRQRGLADPYANLAMPSSIGCDYNSAIVQNTGSVTLIQPGRYCNWPHHRVRSPGHLGAWRVLYQRRNVQSR
jgi:hypothetical protein